MLLFPSWCCSYARSPRPAAITVRTAPVCARPLARLLATCPGIDRVVVDGEGRADADLYAPLMSLPRILGNTLATVPDEVPYLFPDPSLVASWRAEMNLSDDLQVGIAWQGNPHNTRDRSRSFPLTRFEAIARVPGVRLISLQKGYGSEQLRELAGRFEVIDLGSRMGDLMDTAAVMESLDLVICVDSALAHMAGALGVPAWVALPFSADWRWLTDRDDNHWYPTLRLFRQKQWGDWDDVFERIAEESEKSDDDEEQYGNPTSNA